MAKEILSNTVTYEINEDVAILTIHNPPINGLGNTVRQGLYLGLKKADIDQQVTAIVIIGQGDNFSGGADIKQFNTPMALEKPTLREVISTIEQLSKPVTAAIHGAAFGGGLELALGCHYRLGAQNATLALPEVKLGLLPGGGGTQRLPRVVGLKAALNIISTGRKVQALEALSLNLIDKIIDNENMLKTSIDFAKKSTITNFSGRVISKLPLPSEGSIIFEQEKASIKPKASNYLAQIACLECLEATTHLPFEKGLDYERLHFNNLVDSNESKGLRHIFLSERKALKIEDNQVYSVKDRKIQKIAVVGAGTMGGGIAMAFANNGYDVILIERTSDALDRGMQQIKRNYDISMTKGKINQGSVDKCLQLIKPSLSLLDVCNTDLIIEAVFEEMGVKKELFSVLDRLCKKGTILASNTSRLDINEIASVTSSPENVIGLHFFSPANVMKLVEVVRGNKTSLSVINSCIDITKKIGKVPVIVRVCEGFVGNRM